MKHFFVAATRQNEGKTTVALGLTAVLVDRYERVGFIKPVGQRYVKSGPHKVDEDSILMCEALGLDCNIKDMSPIAIDRTFTRKFIDSPGVEELERQIVGAYRRVAENKDLVIIEGTGHAGVGSVINLSNADVAKLLDAKVVLVTGAGIGRAVDEVTLNRCLFTSRGIEVLGVVLNKAKTDKIGMVADYVGRALQQRGVRLLGVIPYVETLAVPTAGQIMDELKCTLLAGEKYLANSVGRIVVGAMSAHRALTFINNNAFCITPGEREDIILAAMSSALVGESKGRKLSGLLLTGGMPPHDSIMQLIRHTQIPVMLIDDDSYTAAAKVHDVVVKIRPRDKAKISLARQLIQEYVDLDYILENS